MPHTGSLTGSVTVTTPRTQTLGFEARQPIAAAKIEVLLGRAQLLALGFEQLKDADQHAVVFELRLLDDALAERQDHAFFVLYAGPRRLEACPNRPRPIAHLHRLTRVKVLLSLHARPRDADLALALIEERNSEHHRRPHTPGVIALRADAGLELRQPAADVGDA